MVSLVSASIDVDGTREPQRAIRLLSSSPCCSSGSRSGSARGSRARGCVAWSSLGAVRRSRSSCPIDRLEYNAGFQSPSLLPVARAVRLEGRARTRGRGVRCVAAGRLAEVRGREHAPRLWLVVGCLDDARRRRSRSATTRTLLVGRPRGRSPGGPPTGSTAPFRPGRRSPSSGARSRGARSPRASATGSWSRRCSTRASGRSIRTGPPTYYETVLPTVPVIARAGSAASSAPEAHRSRRGTCSSRAGGPSSAGSSQRRRTARCSSSRRSAPLRLAPRGALSGRRHGHDTGRVTASRSARRVAVDPVPTPPPFGRSGMPAVWLAALVGVSTVVRAAPHRCACRGRGSSRTSFSTRSWRRASRTGAGRRSGVSRSSAGARSTRR